MAKLKSDYTIELIDHFYDSLQKEYIIVLPFCEKGSLDGLMKEDNHWKLESIYLLLHQIQKGFMEMYKNNIWHLDLKPENILIKS